ncbi:MAG TPA: glycosyltransferase [Anaerolineae bacterium]|nr:glycosyltransferase [Anaerolineae bacterium]
MRAGQFTDSYLPILNGVSTFVHLFKQTLEKFGHEPTVFTFGYTDRVEPGIVRSSGLPLGRTGYHVGLTYSQSAWALARTMDILHTHHPFACGTLAARLSRQLNRPLVFTNHTRYDYYAQHYLPFLPQRAALGLLGVWMRRFTQHCDLIIAVSAAAQTMLQALGVEAPIEIIPNGVDLQQFAQAGPAARSDLGVPAEAFVLMYVGRLGPEKNLSMLFEAFAHTARTASQATLVLVGDGPQDGLARERARELNLGDKVRFLGMRPYSEIPALLGAADAFITASITEGHPMTIIEALAAGRPVLAFDVPGIRETVIDGENGLLAPIDAAALGARMATLASDTGLQARLSDGARRSAVQYSMDITTRRILDHYERLLRERKAI